MINSIKDIEEQIREKQKAIRYDIRSHSINELIKQFQHGDLYIPHYQRGFVWNKQKQSFFIESMIIGLPTSSLFFAHTDDYRTEVIDGVQRLKTLEAFCNNDLKLKGLEQLYLLNDLSFSDLPANQQRKLLHRTISVITLSEETSFDARLELFARMNQGGAAKSHHDIRLALFDGPFVSFIREMANREYLYRTVSFSSFMKRRRDNEEFLLRFFCLSEALNLYRGSMNNFLDKCVKELNHGFDAERLELELENTSYFVKRYLSDVFAEKGKIFNRVLLETIFVGANLALRENPHLSPRRLDWLFEDEFKNITRIHAIQSSKRLKDRIIFVKNLLLGDY